MPLLHVPVQQELDPERLPAGGTRELLRGSSSVSGSRVMSLLQLAEIGDAEVGELDVDLELRFCPEDGAARGALQRAVLVAVLDGEVHLDAHLEF